MIRFPCEQYHFHEIVNHGVEGCGENLGEELTRAVLMSIGVEFGKHGEWVKAANISGMSRKRFHPGNKI